MEVEYSAVEHQKKYSRGKLIVLIIAILNVIGAFRTIFINSNIIALIVQIILSIALYRGVSWVRYFFVVGAGATVFYVLYMLFCGIQWSTVNANIGKYPLILYLVYLLIKSVAVCILLFKSEAVSEFLYRQKNDRSV